MRRNSLPIVSFVHTHLISTHCLTTLPLVLQGPPQTTLLHFLNLNCSDCSLFAARFPALPANSAPYSGPNPVLPASISLSTLPNPSFPLPPSTPLPLPLPVPLSPPPARRRSPPLLPPSPSRVGSFLPLPPFHWSIFCVSLPANRPPLSFSFLTDLLLGAKLCLCSFHLKNILDPTQF